MVSTTTATDVSKFIKDELPLVTSLFKKVEISDDIALQELFEADDVAEMTEKFFTQFSVDPASFFLGNYYPWKTKSFFSRKPQGPDKKPLTINMYIESARAGKWLFD